MVEILVVMSIAALLLALVLGLTGRVKARQMESRLQAEMAAIELALENYNAKNGQYPPSKSWNNNYPVSSWSQSLQPKGVPPPIIPRNMLYSQLCKNDGQPFLPDIKPSQADGDMLLSSVPNNNGTYTAWGYNSLDPKYNKNTYDLWVEHGDYGDDGVVGGGDDTVRVISNWSN